MRRSNQSGDNMRLSEVHNQKEVLARGSACLCDGHELFAAHHQQICAARFATGTSVMHHLPCDTYLPPSIANSYLQHGPNPDKPHNSAQVVAHALPQHAAASQGPSYILRLTTQESSKESTEPGHPD